MNHFQNRIYKTYYNTKYSIDNYRSYGLFFRPNGLIIFFISVLPSLYILDVLIDISYWGSYSTSEFGTIDVVGLWILSALSLAVFIAILFVLLYVTYNLIILVKGQALPLFKVSEIYGYMSWELKQSYPYLFVIFVAFGTLFLFIDLPFKYALDFKLYQTMAISEQQQLYKNQDLSELRVQRVQRQLADYGYDIGVDGIYGPNTQNKALDYLQKVDFDISDEKQDYAGTYVLMTENVSDFLYELQQLSKNNKEELE